MQLLLRSCGRLITSSPVAIYENLRSRTFVKKALTMLILVKSSVGAQKLFKNRRARCRTLNNFGVKIL